MIVGYIYSISVDVDLYNSLVNAYKPHRANLFCTVRELSTGETRAEIYALYMWVLKIKIQYPQFYKTSI
jgi:hypothetical protein